MSWCPECKKELPGDEEICPVCGGLTESKMPRSQSCTGDCASCTLHCEDEEECGDCDPGIWPSNEDGTPVKPVRLMTVTGTQVDYQMAVTQLQSFGVPVVGNFTPDGALSKAILGFSGTGMDIIVPETMAELARELMKPIEEDEEA